MCAQLNTVFIQPEHKISVTLKSNCLNLFDYTTESLWTFDLEGRLVGMYIDRINYRRTLDNRFYAKSRKKIYGKVFRYVDPVPGEFAGELIGRATWLFQSIKTRLPEETVYIVQKIIDMDMSGLERSADEFQRIYLPISVLPPDQYMSLVLQVTEGCNYNRCIFCNFYKDRPFRVKTLGEIEQHIAEIRQFFGKGLKLRKSIFLADANALVIPQNKIIPVLFLLKENWL